MDRVFSYQPNVIVEMRRENRRRSCLWLAVALLLVIAGVASDGPSWLAAGCIVLAMGIIGLFELVNLRFLRQTAEVASHRIEVTGTLLRQIDPDGHVVGQVNLAHPFKVTHPHDVAGSAVYTVRGEGGQVRFSSRINEAEILVRNVLQQDEWPPGANAT